MCGKTQKLKFGQNSKTRNVTELSKTQNLENDKILKPTIWQLKNTKYDKAKKNSKNVTKNKKNQIVTKPISFKCDKTKKLKL